MERSDIRVTKVADSVRRRHSWTVTGAVNDADIASLHPPYAIYALRFPAHREFEISKRLAAEIGALWLDVTDGVV